jgi:hypothetical protein
VDAAVFVVLLAEHGTDGLGADHPDSVTVSSAVTPITFPVPGRFAVQQAFRAMSLLLSAPSWVHDEPLRNARVCDPTPSPTRHAGWGRGALRTWAAQRLDRTADGA